MSKEELNFYKTIFRNSKDALLIIKNRVFIDCNDSALKMIGYKKKSDFLSSHPSELSPQFQKDGKESFQKAQEMMDEAVSNGSHRFEWIHKRADGSFFPVEVLLTTLSSEPDNEIIYTTWRDISDKEEAIDNTLNSESRLKSLMQQSPFIIELYDLNGLQIEVNKAYEDLWGITSDSTVNKFNILKSEEVKERGLYNFILKAYEGDAVIVPAYKFEPWGVPEDGIHNKALWLNTKIYPLKDPNDKVTGIVITHEDVTSRQKILRDLQFSEERFRSLVETTNDFIWEVDTEARYTYVSPQIKNILGMEPGHFMGKTPFDFMPENERIEVGQSFGKYVSKQESFEALENINVHSDGHFIVLETSGVPFYDSKGEFAGYRGIDRDISNRKKYEEQLLLTDSVFKNSIEGIVITDTEGIIQKVNHAFSVITGFSSKEAIGNNPRVLKSERHDDMFYKEMWDSLKKQGQWSGEIWNRKKDGTVYPEWLSISAIRNDKGITTNYISVFHDISEDKLKEKKMEFMAFHDPLTQLPNRRLFYDRLHVSIETAKRMGSSLALFYMDIDNFKDINDTYGHPFGDDFLCAVKDRINGICRTSDTFARYGGDEFIILLNGIESAEMALEFSERLINLFKEPLLVKGESVFSSLSIGLTIFPRDGHDIDTLQKNADLALYKAKEDGKRQTFQYRRELHELALQKNIMNNGLREAMEDFSTFSLVYQPKMDINTLEIYGLEALVRWELNGERISPDQFIPLAEESNLIIPLGRWILKQAMVDIKQIHDIGLHDVSLAINLSTRQFNDEFLFESIDDAIDQTGFNKSKLVFEITESTSINDVDNAVLIMNKLKSRGFELSIDDFGTGYSSLSYLKKFPLHELKIDRSFIDDIPNDPNDNAICKTIINMAKSLNYKVVAEGVENLDQLLFLKENGCQIVQGYYFYKPMAIEEVKKLAIEFLGNKNKT